MLANICLASSARFDVMQNPGDKQRDIAIITDDPGWHGRQLFEELQRRTYQPHYVRLQDCHFDIGQVRPYLRLSHLKHYPRGVFVRGVPGGNLETVVYYLDILHALEAVGVPVVNNVRAIEKSVDKGMTSFLLSQQEIPTPNTIFSSDLHYVRAKLREGLSAGKKYVLKPLFGSQGKGLQRIESIDQWVNYDALHGVMYAQEFIESGHDVGVDFRVFVVGGRVIASMQRTGVDWISNVAQGAQVEAIKLNREVENLAVNAVGALNMEYAGVDLIQDAYGNFWVTEVNSVPAWKGLQQTTSTSIVRAIVDDFLTHCDPISVRN